MRYLFSLLQASLILPALAFSLMVGPSMAEEPVTKWQFGCEWQKAENGNYWFKVDGGCKHWLAMGYSNVADYLRDVKKK